MANEGGGPTVLVVESARGTPTSIVDVLRQVNYRVTRVTSFADGRAQLAARSLDLMITDVRLGAFNGLQLVIQRALSDPGRPSIVTGTSPDPVLEAEARGLGAAYVVKPIESVDLLKLVADGLGGPRADRRQWRRTQRPGGGPGALDAGRNGEDEIASPSGARSSIP